MATVTVTRFNKQSKGNLKAFERGVGHQLDTPASEWA